MVGTQQQGPWLGRWLGDHPAGVRLGSRLAEAGLGKQVGGPAAWRQGQENTGMVGPGGSMEMTATQRCCP